MGDSKKAILTKAPAGMQLDDFVGREVTVVKEEDGRTTVSIPGYPRGIVSLPSRFLTLKD